MTTNDKFDALVARHTGLIRHIGRGLLPPESDVEDFAQDVVLKAYAARDQLRDPSKASAWIGAIARNTARSRIRKLRAEGAARETMGALSGGPPSPLESVLRAEARAAASAAVAGLPDDERDAVAARYAADLTPAEIARRDGLSYSVVTSRLHRARRRLRRVLGVAVSWALTRQAAATGSSYLGAGRIAVCVVTAICVHAAVLLALAAYRGPVSGDAGVAETSDVQVFAAAQDSSTVPTPLEVATVQDGGHVRTRDGFYATAGGPTSFDNVPWGGLTIEGWYYLPRAPQSREKWLLFAKPGSYTMELRGARPPLGPNPPPYSLDTRVYGTVTETVVGSTLGPMPLFEGQLPIRRWFHVSLQARRWPFGYPGPFLAALLRPPLGDRWAAPTARSVSIDGRQYGGADGGAGLARTDQPFLVGGALPTPLNAQSTWGDGSQDDEGVAHQPFPGLVGSVRVSSTVRYPMYAERITPTFDYVPDEDTSALWRFDAGPGAESYTDASGHGHHLTRRKLP